MRRLFLFSIVTVFLASGFFACKKDKKETPAPPTTANKLQYKWSVESEVFTGEESGVPQNFTYTGTASDFVDFRTDGKVYSDVNSEKDTASYTVSNDTTINLEGENFKILTLTDKVLKLYSKDTSDLPDFFEVTLNLKR